jgi:uncharacterized SAM-binding protein YcdF (DUF218 family)
VTASRAGTARRVGTPQPAPGGPSGAVRRVTWRGRLRDLAIVIVAFAFAAASALGYATFRVWQVGGQDTRHHADAIVVLGAAQYNGRPSPVLAARLDHAIDLWNQGYAEWFVVTGGKLQGDRYTEADTERRYAVARGVPAAAILAETTGRTTLESMQHVRALFDKNGLHSALVVSDRTHMLRVLRLAADQGIVAWSSPTDTSPTDLDPNLHFDSVVHEVGAMGLYLLVEQAGADASPAANPTSPNASGGPSTAPIGTGKTSSGAGSPGLRPSPSRSPFPSGKPGS